MLFCLTPYPKTYLAWSDLPGAQGSRQYNSDNHKGTQASLPQQGTAPTKVAKYANGNLVSSLDTIHYKQVLLKVTD